MTVSLWICQVCGHIAFDRAPEACPVCEAPREKFKHDPGAVQDPATEGREKHVPVITPAEGCGIMPGVCRDVQVAVGANPHPMTPEHWIQWIDCYLDRTFLGRWQMVPEHLQAAVGVHLKADAKGEFTAIEHCNKHGYWMASAALK